jgi:hypothetical protein
MLLDSDFSCGQGPTIAGRKPRSEASFIDDNEKGCVAADDALLVYCQPRSPAAAAEEQRRNGRSEAVGTQLFQRGIDVCIARGLRCYFRRRHEQRSWAGAAEEQRRSSGGTAGPRLWGGRL